MPGIPEVELLERFRQAITGGRILHSQVYNQAELAEILGVSQATVRRLLQEIEVAQSIPHIRVQRKERGTQVRYAIYFLPDGAT